MRSRHVRSSDRRSAVNEAFEVRGHRAGDEIAILEAFNRVFARIDEHFVPRTRDEWRWEFQANPGGSRISLAVATDGRVVAQYAGIGQRVLIDGRASSFSQSVDSFVDPDFALGLARSRAFVRAGELYAATFGGAGVGQDEVMWGLPVPSALRIGRRALGYEALRTLTRLEAPVDVLVGRLDAQSASEIEVRETTRVPDELAQLFARFAEPFGYVAIRDRALLEWRYLRRPGRSYRIAIARRAGSLLGLVVLAIGAFDRVRGGLLCDWIVPRGEDSAARALLAWLARTTRAAGESRVIALAPDTSAEWLAFQRAGFKVRDTSYLVVARSYVRSIGIDDLRRRWWWTLGDTDLV